MLYNTERRCKYFQSGFPFRGKCRLISDDIVRHIPDKCNDIGLGCAIREGQLQKDNDRLMKINQDYSEALDRIGLVLQAALARISELEADLDTPVRMVRLQDSGAVMGELAVLRRLREKDGDYINELEGALRPFSDAADVAEEIRAVKIGTDEIRYPVRVGDLRAARAALGKDTPEEAP